MSDVIQQFSVSQYVKIEKKAMSLGKTVPEYIAFILEKKVGTTRSVSCAA